MKLILILQLDFLFRCTIFVNQNTDSVKYYCFFFLFPKIEDQVSPRMSTLRPRVSQQNQNYISQYDDEDFEPVYPTPTTPRRSSIRPVDQRKIKSFYQNEEEYKVVETDCLENFGVQNRDIGGLAIGKKIFSNLLANEIKNK